MALNGDATNGELYLDSHFFMFAIGYTSNGKTTGKLVGTKNRLFLTGLMSHAMRSILRAASLGVVAESDSFVQLHGLRVLVSGDASDPGARRPLDDGLCVRHCRHHGGGVCRTDADHHSGNLSVEPTPNRWVETVSSRNYVWVDCLQSELWVSGLSPVGAMCELTVSSRSYVWVNYL